MTGTGATSVEGTPLEQLAQFVAAVSYDELPEVVTRSLRLRLLDVVGLCLAARPLETSDMAFAVARSWGSDGKAHVIGFDTRMRSQAAAFVNGVLAHSLDFDDTHLPSVLHPSACIVPAALATAEEVGATVEQMLAAAAGGYEVCIRTGMAAYDRQLGNSVFFERGWHATSICGTLAAAATSARLQGLDAERIGHAMAIAASMGSGIIEANRSGGSVKRLHCGWAAHAGIVAAQCAAAGLTGPVTTFEGRFGFYRAFCDGQVQLEELTRNLGRQWSIPEVFYKPYPANHFTHTGIDAALRLRERVEPDEIEQMELGVATPTVRTIGEPRSEKIRPRSGYHGQFSGPFAVAVALVGGGGLGVWLDDFSDEKAADRRILELAERVRVVGNAECDAIFPHQFPCVLKVKLRDGQRLEEKVLVNRGGPANPLSEEELRLKFMANAGRSLSSSQAEALADVILAPGERAPGERAPDDRPAEALLAALEVEAQLVGGAVERK